MNNKKNIGTSFKKSGVNTVMMIGSVNSEITAELTEDGIAVARFTIEVAHKFYDIASKAYIPSVDVFHVEARGHNATYCKEYGALGRSIYIDGNLRVKTFKTKKGEEYPQVVLFPKVVNYFFAKKTEETNITPRDRMRGIKSSYASAKGKKEASAYDDYGWM